MGLAARLRHLGSARARHGLRRCVRAAIRRLITTPAGLGLVNGIHRRLTPEQKHRFFFMAFDEGWQAEGLWRVDFGERSLRLPLHRDFHLGWVAAIGFHGHDPAIHSFYERVVRSPRPPRVFFDVGACYGLHSLKMLAHGVTTLSFEPNPACHPFFVEACAVNGLAGEVHGIAVADRSGWAELMVPGPETYHGTIADEVKRRWRDRLDVKTLVVRQQSLDEFVDERGVEPDLIKIDTEGTELAVLEGSRRLLERCRPQILFESWQGSPDRAPLFAVLAARGYRVHALTGIAGEEPALSPSGFAGSPAINFVARPASR
jgi:FkbM family methyltransferase